MQCHLSDRNIDVVQLQKSLYSKTKLESIENPRFSNAFMAAVAMSGRLQFSSTLVGHVSLHKSDRFD